MWNKVGWNTSPSSEAGGVSPVPMPALHSVPRLLSDRWVINIVVYIFPWIYKEKKCEYTYFFNNLCLYICMGSICIVYSSHKMKTWDRDDPAAPKCGTAIASDLLLCLYWLFTGRFRTMEPRDRPVNTVKQCFKHCQNSVAFWSCRTVVVPRDRSAGSSIPHFGAADRRDLTFPSHGTAIFMQNLPM